MWIKVNGAPWMSGNVVGTVKGRINVLRGIIGKSGNGITQKERGN